MGQKLPIYFPVSVNHMYTALCYTAVSELPGSIELHKDSTLQRCAAELKLQHEVHLHAKRGEFAELYQIVPEEVKYEWAESSH